MPFSGLRRRTRFIGVLIAFALLFTVAPAAEAASAPYLKVEQYYLRLMNCTRTGGVVKSTGACSGYGSGKNGGYQKPLTLSKAVSNKVSRPYAKLLVDRQLCNHFYDHDPSYRLRRAGISYSQWGENIGCRDNSNPYASVLASHLNFQSEKTTNGWHWRNIKNPKLQRVGIGLYKSGDHIRFVVDFYTP